MAMFEFKNGYHEHMCYDDIGLRSQDISIILGSIFNIFWKTCAST